MPKIVRLNDASNHGGKMIQATGNFTVDGVQACVNGDQHSCPIPGHGVTSVTSSSANTGSGKPIIRVGDKAGCGAALSAGGSATTT
jgi:uncharacterized Zn-binding protein involved in type VI secretion